MATASEVLKLAESYIGVKENPPYSNNVIFNTHYYGGAEHAKNLHLAPGLRRERSRDFY